LRQKLDIERSARQLANFFQASVELMKVMARACGHSALAEFNRQDIATWHRDIAELTGIEYTGFDNRR
jgi:glutamate synthase domain-containing protein 2